VNDPNNKSNEGLVRTIGTRALGTNIFNMVVGGGIFVLPGVIAARLGPSAIIAYLICAVAIGFIFLCYAEIGSRITRSGGSYAYIEEAFGPFAGFIASILLWFGWAVLADAALIVAMVETMAIAFPKLEDPIWRSTVIIGMLAFLVVTNVRGVKSGVNLYIITTIAKFIPLGLLLVVGLFFINVENLVITEWPSVQNIGASTLILIFAFSGAECALNASGEIKNPSKTVPRGMLLGLGSIFILFLGLQSVAQGVLGSELANNTEAPLAAAAKIVFGEWGVTMLLIGGVISIFSTISGDILVTPRVVFASARDGSLPKILAKVHPKYKTPYVSVIFFSVVLGVIALTGSFKTLAVLASGSILMVYAGVSLAVIKLRYRDGDPVKGQFKIPGKALIPVLSCLVIIWMLWQLTLTEAISLLILVGVSIIFYVARLLLQRKNS
jgi:basic amino acid/polyamine antiporter, APA family